MYWQKRGVWGTSGDSRALLRAQLADSIVRARRFESHPLRHFLEIVQYVIFPQCGYWQNYWQIWRIQRWILFSLKALRSLIVAAAAPDRSSNAV